MSYGQPYGSRDGRTRAYPIPGQVPPAQQPGGYDDGRDRRYQPQGGYRQPPPPQQPPPGGGGYASRPPRRKRRVGRILMIVLLAIVVLIAATREEFGDFPPQISILGRTLWRPTRRPLSVCKYPHSRNLRFLTNHTSYDWNWSATFARDYPREIFKSIC